MTIAMLGLLITFAVWWLYYDNRNVIPMRKTFSLIALWEYAHLPLMIGISILGICIHHAFNRYDQHLSIELSMLFIAFAVVMGSLALLNIACYLGGISHNKACLQMIFFRLLCVFISLLFLIGIHFLTPLSAIIILTILGVAQIFINIFLFG